MIKIFHKDMMDALPYNQPKIGRNFYVTFYRKTAKTIYPTWNNNYLELQD